MRQLCYRDLLLIKYHNQPFGAMTCHNSINYVDSIHSPSFPILCIYGSERYIRGINIPASSNGHNIVIVLVIINRK